MDKINQNHKKSILKQPNTTRHQIKVVEQLFQQEFPKLQLVPRLDLDHALMKAAMSPKRDSRRKKIAEKNQKLLTDR